MRTIHELATTNLNLLVAFEVLYERRSVTRAAADLGLTQSAMSHTLARLRLLTGDALFVRDGRGLAPTPRADALILPLRRALHDLADALHHPGAPEPATSRRAFSLATVDLFDLVVLPGLVAALTAAAPLASVLVRAHGPASFDNLHQGAIDLAIHPVLAGPDPLPSAGLMRRTLFREGFVVLARAEPQADLRTVRGYAGARHVVVSPSGAGRSPVDAALDEAGHPRTVTLRVPSFSAALALVARSDLVLTAPATLRKLAPAGVRAFEPPLPLPDHAVTMVWSSRYDEDPLHVWLRELVVQETRAARGEVGSDRRAPS